MASPASSPGSKSLDGSVALVTGAGTRLGRAIAEALAARGCHLLLHAHRSRREAAALARKFRASGGRASALTADLSKSAQAQGLAREAWRAFGRVDILDNSAAIFRPTPLERLDAGELDAFLALNLRAPYLLSAELGRRMRRSGRGVIVNLACVSALRPWKEFVPYSISKAGLLALTVGLAKLLAPEVRVNAVAPGTVLPPEEMPRAQREAIRKRLPLQRLGTPEDVVRAVLYLLESDFVTGQVLCVDGGRSIV